LADHIHHTIRRWRIGTRTLQTLRGTGKVFAGKLFLCEGRYSVSVQQGISYTRFQPSAGAADIQGTLVIVDGERHWKKGLRLSRRMEDGHTAECITTTGNAAVSTFGIHVSDLSRRP
jgi:hypothetical protein